MGMREEDAAIKRKRVVAARERGDSEEKIAERYDLTRNKVRSILKAAGKPVETLHDGGWGAFSDQLSMKLPGYSSRAWTRTKSKRRTF